MRIAVDTGGTFTDCVFLRNGKLEVLKVFSTPADPGEAIIAAIREIEPGSGADIRHGTTVGTNTLLERKGARVAFVTTDAGKIVKDTHAELKRQFGYEPPGKVLVEVFATREMFSGRTIALPTLPDLAAGACSGTRK